MSEKTLLPVGQAATDFALHATPEQALALRELRGRPIVRVLYPADWSPVCGDRIGLTSELPDQFSQHHAQLADVDPKGEISRLYGVSVAEADVSERALNMVDAAGIIRWRFLSPIGVNPGADGILAALESPPVRAALYAT